MTTKGRTDLTRRVQKLRTQHSLSQEELAQKLGVARSAISQIENGERSVSSDELKSLSEIFGTTSDFLLGLENEPEVILERGPRNKEPAVEERISVPHYRAKKFKEVLLYVLERCAGKPNVGETLIYKMLYFADFNYYELFEEQFTGASYRKLKFGPVPREFGRITKEMINKKELMQVKDSYYGHPQTRYLPLRKADLRQLSAAEKDVLDSVIARFSDKSAKWLSDYSHDDIPWKATAEKGVIDYELVFYRTPAYSVRDYDKEEEA